MAVHQCQHCHTTFSRRGTRPRFYCSRTCYNAHRREHLGTCATCGRPLQKNQKQFCSKSCHQATRRVDSGTCAQCGKHIEKRRKRDGKPHFCSRECGYQHRKVTELFTDKGHRMVLAPDGFPGTIHKRRFALEHYVVWWIHYGWVPRKPFVIHHIDKNKLNNTIENLACMTNSEHSKLHSSDKLNKPHNTPIAVTE